MEHKEKEFEQDSKIAICGKELNLAKVEMQFKSV